MPETEPGWLDGLARRLQELYLSGVRALPEPIKRPLRQGVGRVATNVIDPFGYGKDVEINKSSDIAALFRPKELAHTLAKIYQDRPAFSQIDPEAIEVGDPDPEAAAKARRPLFREYFDLPIQDVDSVYTQHGKNFRINPQTQNVIAQHVLKQFEGEDSAEPSTNMLSRAYHPGQPDPWNFDVSPEELAQYKGRHLPLELFGRQYLEALGRPAVLETGGYQEGGIVPQFGGTNMNGISMAQIAPGRRRIRRGDMMGSGIGMGRPRNTFPMPLQDKSGITMAQTAPAYAPAPGSTDTVPAMLTPGEGVLNTGAMRMIGEPAVNALNRYGKGISMQGYEEGGVAKEDETSRLAGTAAASALYRQLMDKYGFTWPEEQLIPDFWKVRASLDPVMAESGGVIPGFQGGTGRVGGQREIGRGEFVRTDYGPGMPSLGRSPADLNEFTGSYENPLGPNDVAVHPNNPFSLKPGPNAWTKIGDEWKHVADYLNRRLDPRKIDFYHPKQPPLQGGFGGRRGPVFGLGPLHQGGGPISEGGGTGGGGWGGGGDWGAGGVPGVGSPPPGQVSISAPGMSGPEVMEWAPGFNWKPWMQKGELPSGPGQGMSEGGIVPGYAEGTSSAGSGPGSGKPTRDVIGNIVGGASNLIFPGLGFAMGPLSRWITQQIQSGKWGQQGTQSFIPSKPSQQNAGAPPAAAPPISSGGPSGGGVERGFEGLGGGGFEPLQGAGVGTIGMGGSLGPASGYGSQGQYWKPWLTRGYLPSNPGQGVATGGIVMEGGVAPSYAEGTSAVQPIGYTDPIEEAEWQKVIPMLPPNTDVAKLKQSGIDPQTVLKLFGSVYGGFQGAGTSPTGYNDLAAGGGA